MNTLDLGDPRNRVLGKILRFHAESRGDHPFLLDDERVLSFDQANSLVNSYVNGLRRLGLRRGDRLVIYMHGCLEFVLLTLAVNKLGAVWTPINTDYKGEWLVGAVNASKGSLLVTNARLLPRIRQVEDQLRYGRLLVYGGDTGGSAMALDELAGHPDDEPDMSRNGYGDTVAILWTSGTTGKPKGVMQSNNVWIRVAEATEVFFRSNEGDLIYNCLPLYNSGAWSFHMYRALCVGLPCATDEQFSVTKFWDRIRHYRATQTMTIGAMHMFLWNEPPREDDADHSLRKGCMTPVPQRLIAPFCERFGLEGILQGYGQSEVLMVLNKWETPTMQLKPNALGKVAQDLELKLLDDEGREVGPGETGEFFVRPKAPHVIFNGYFEDEEATRSAYRGEWYGTGDLGMRDEDGAYFFMDRKKDYIRYKGRNVSSLQVESVANTHPAVQATAAYGVPAAELESEHEIKLDVILKPGCQLLPEELARYINDHAPYFCVPRYIEFVADLPYTPTQKIEKYKLRAKGLTGGYWDRQKADFVLER